MAEAGSVSAPDLEAYMKSSFKIFQVPHDVSLSATTLSWVKNGNDSSKSENVPFREILYAENLSGARGAEGGFELCFMKHKKKNVRRHKIIQFVGNAEEGETWSRKIQDAVDQVPGRPHKLLVLVNPVSGSSKGRQIYKKNAEGLFRMARIQTDVIVTEKAHHTEEILSTYDLNSIDGIALVGGDGLIHEAYNGLQTRMMKEAGLDKNDLNMKVQPLTLPIGIIPAGTGNGIAADCNGTYDIESAVLTVIEGKTLPFHAAGVHCCGEFVCFSTLHVGCGLWSDVIYRTETRRHLGKLRYAVGLIESLLIKSPRLTELVIDYLTPGTATTESRDNESETHGSKGSDEASTLPWQQTRGVFSGAILFMGDILHLCENVEGQEPGLPVILTRPMTRLQMLGFFKKFITFDSSLRNDERIAYMPVKEYKLKVAHPSDVGSEIGRMERSLNIDGEWVPVKDTEVLVRLHPNTVQMYARGKFLGSMITKSRDS